MLGYAASHGKRRVGVVVPPLDFGRLQAAAASAAGAALGLAVAPLVVTDGAGDVVAALRANAGGTLPDTVYLPVVDPALDAQAAALGAAGVQILESDQWSAITPSRTPSLIGAWFAAPDPIRYEAFAAAFAEQTGAEARVLAGLAFDAVEMARLLGRIGQQTRKGLLRGGGFEAS